jgi:hypothetical protein
MLAHIFLGPGFLRHFLKVFSEVPPPEHFSPGNFLLAPGNGCRFLGRGPHFFRLLNKADLLQHPFQGIFGKAVQILDNLFAGAHDRILPYRIILLYHFMSQFVVSSKILRGPGLPDQQVALTITPLHCLATGLTE